MCTQFELYRARGIYVALLVRVAVCVTHQSKGTSAQPHECCGVYHQHQNNLQCMSICRLSRIRSNLLR